MERIKASLAVSLVISVFVMIVGISSLYVQEMISSGNACGCTIPLTLFIPFLASIGLFIGTLVFYLYSPDFKQKGMEPEDLLFFFDGNERELMEKILKKKGSCTQAYLTRNTKMTKVQVYRSLSKLKKRGIINKKKHGKTNRIILKKKIKQILSNK